MKRADGIEIRTDDDKTWGLGRTNSEDLKPPITERMPTENRVCVTIAERYIGGVKA
jgi:hypothetical protein